MPDSLGIYLHVPFCRSKCGYCDFYSVADAPDRMDRYVDALCARLERFAGAPTPPVDSVYFGGGTPSLLGGERIARLLAAVGRSFRLHDPEITLEANPADDLADLFRRAADAGVNRLSLGMQTAVPSELAALGRRHTNADLLRTVSDARAAGIENLSLDLMLGLPNQTRESLRESLRALCGLAPEHVSAYLLKIEPGTPFDRVKADLPLPDEDAVCEQYEFAAEALEGFGLRQYEISNFARPGRESRHNLKYWTGAPYLGFGPAAHSFYDGRRFYFPRDLEAFCAGCEPVDDGPGGGEDEYLMLRLRLCEGVSFCAFRARFGRPMPAAVQEKARRLAGRACG